MDTWTLIAIVVAVLVVVAIALSLRKGKEEEKLPPSADAPRPETRPRELERAAAERAEPKKKETQDAEIATTAKTVEPAQPPSEALAPEPAIPARVEARPPAEAVPREASAEELAALKTGLGSTRGGFISRLASLFSRKKTIDPALLDEIEEVLITADIGVATTDKILARMRAALEDGTIADGDAAWTALREHCREILSRPGSGGVRLDQTPTVILVVGVNGVGKTTTIGKLASRFQAEGKTVLLAAGDTFRAAAVLQLQVWARRVGCELVRGKDRADPASVIFDAVTKGKEMGADVVICDTAGRLHTKSPLMAELEKVGRTAEKALGRPADEVLLVLDSTTGQNAIQQAELFKEALPVNGIVLSKLDGTAKGGVILGIVDSHEIPVRYVGIGERVEDLKEFDPDAFVDALFASPDPAPNSSDEVRAAP